MNSILNIFGFTIRRTPKSLLFLFCFCISLLCFASLPSRRKIIFDNLRKSFPEENTIWLLFTALKSVMRTIEQGLLSLAMPHMTKHELKKNFSMGEKCQTILTELSTDTKACLFLIPHFCHADALSLLPLYLPPQVKIHVLFRPLDNPSVNQYILNSRERFGITGINRRRRGVRKTIAVMKRKQTLALLFDQHTGQAGTRMKFMGRDCSCTTLPDIFNRKIDLNAVLVYTKREGFWRSQIHASPINLPVKSIMFSANLWLEDALRSDAVLRESWLWLHKRWKPLKTTEV